MNECIHDRFYEKFNYKMAKKDLFFITTRLCANYALVSFVVYCI